MSELAKPPPTMQIRDGHWPQMILMQQVVLTTLAQFGGGSLYVIESDNRRLGFNDHTKKWEFNGTGAGYFESADAAIKAWQEYVSHALPTARFPWQFPTVVLD